jgi:hypothetical protein
LDCSYQATPHKAVDRKNPDFGLVGTAANGDIEDIHHIHPGF